MLYREFGKTKEKTSILGYGAMRLPLVEGTEQIDEERAIAQMRYAITKGINYMTQLILIMVERVTPCWKSPKRWLQRKG